MYQINFDLMILMNIQLLQKFNILFALNTMSTQLCCTCTRCSATVQGFTLQTKRTIGDHKTRYARQPLMPIPQPKTPDKPQPQAQYHSPLHKRPRRRSISPDITASSPKRLHRRSISPNLHGPDPFDLGLNFEFGPRYPHSRPTKKLSTRFS